MAVTRLTAKDITWADIVFISAMQIQKTLVRKSVRPVQRIQCSRRRRRAVRIGKLQRDPGASSYFILNEAEITLPRFLHDYERGCPQKVYEDHKSPI